MTTESQKGLIYRMMIITLLVVAVYANTLNHQLVWDDINVIVDNPLFDSLRNIPKFFISEDVADGSNGYYRPITYVSFALDRAIWGLNPVGFNITNLVLHILVALLFYRVIAIIFERENLALVAALLFALHPIAGETVNFHAGGRNTLLCACFSLLSLLLYARRKQLPAVICFALAILSKEFALLMPVLFFMYDRFIAKEKQRWVLYLPFLIAITSYLGLRSYVVAKNANLLTSINIANTIWIVPQIIGSYVKNMLFPLGLKTMYDVNTKITWFSFLSYSLLLFAIIGAAFIFRKRREVVSAIIVFLLFLLPVSNIFPLGATMMADRYAYFSLFGFSLALAYCICLVNTRAILPITALLCLCFITIDIKHNGYWKDEPSLFMQMIKDAPEMSIGFQNLGYAYYDKQDFVNAEKYLTAAYDKKDVNSRMLVGSASMFWEMKKLDKALLVLNKKIEMEPKNPQPYIMASRIYEETGNTSLAKQYHDKAVELYPDIYEMMNQRAVAVCKEGEELMARHKTVAAERLFKEALNIDPNFAPALIDMGSMFAETGNPAKALEYITKAEKFDPLNPAIHHNLSLIYEMLGRTVDAQREMDKFKELDAHTKQQENAVQR